MNKRPDGKSCSRDAYTSKKHNIEKIREQFRKLYTSKVKAVRDNDVSKRRNIDIDSICINVIWDEIRDSLNLENYDPEDEEEVLNELQEEVSAIQLDDQARKHDQQEQNELNNIVQRHLVLCTICERYSAPVNDNSSEVCAKCIEETFKDS